MGEGTPPVQKSMFLPPCSSFPARCGCGDGPPSSLRSAKAAAREAGSGQPAAGCCASMCSRTCVSSEQAKKACRHRHSGGTCRLPNGSRQQHDPFGQHALLQGASGAITPSGAPFLGACAYGKPPFSGSRKIFPQEKPVRRAFSVCNASRLKPYSLPFHGKNAVFPLSLGRAPLCRRLAVHLFQR